MSFNENHNDANGEENQDGESHNRSWNCGIEGPGEDAEVIALRRKQKRNFLTTLLLSQGVPMMVAGDELGRSQKGNNNAYCQDNEISWLNWEDIDEELLAFTRDLLTFRNEHPAFRRRQWFLGREIRGAGVSDILWFRPDGTLMEDSDWDMGLAKSLAVFINGDDLRTMGSRGEVPVDSSFMIFFNAWQEPVEFCFPEGPWGERWREIVDTAKTRFPEGRDDLLFAGDTRLVEGRAIVILERV